MREREAAFGFADLLLSLSVSLHSPQSVSVSRFALGGEVGQIREDARARLGGREEGGACAMNTSEGGRARYLKYTHVPSEACGQVVVSKAVTLDYVNSPETCKVS